MKTMNEDATDGKDEKGLNAFPGEQLPSLTQITSVTAAGTSALWSRQIMST